MEIKPQCIPKGILLNNVFFLSTQGCFSTLFFCLNHVQTKLSMIIKKGY